MTDSLLLESPSQGASQSGTENKLENIVTIPMFDSSHTFRFFSESIPIYSFSIIIWYCLYYYLCNLLDEINISFIEKNSGIKDVPKLSQTDLVGYIQAETQVFCINSILNDIFLIPSYYWREIFADIQHMPASCPADIYFSSCL